MPDFHPPLPNRWLPIPHPHPRQNPDSWVSSSQQEASLPRMMPNAPLGREGRLIPTCPPAEGVQVTEASWSLRPVHTWLQHLPTFTHLTDSVKPPGQLLLGLARKLPCWPLDISSLSASTPLMLG